MDDPYQVLNLPPGSDDEVIRRRYLELVRQYPPEHHPEKFAAVRAAYERLKDSTTRLRRQLFDVGGHGGMERIIEEVACRSQRRRLSLTDLLSPQGKH